MDDPYDRQAVYVRAVESQAASRSTEIDNSLREAFSSFLERRETDVILFGNMTAEQLASAISHHPNVLKPLLSICNLAARAVERDLGLRGLNTYHPKMTDDSSLLIAGYIKSFLPPYVEIPALVQIDRVQFIDKEVRSYKGNWERRVTQSLNSLKPGFKKRKFVVGSEQFEIDAAWPTEGDIELAVDIKRIEAPRDIHKRCDEVVNKATKFRRKYRKGRFAAVVYYPFVEQHQNVRSRLRSRYISAVYFAGSTDESIDTTTEMMLAELAGGERT